MFQNITCTFLTRINTYKMIQKHQKFFVDWWIAASDENEKNDFTKVLESAYSLQVDNAAIDEDTNEPPTFTIIMLRNIKIHIYGKTEGLSVDFIEHVKKTHLWRCPKWTLIHPTLFVHQTNNMRSVHNTNSSLYGLFHDKYWFEFI